MNEEKGKVRLGFGFHMDVGLLLGGQLIDKKVYLGSFIGNVFELIDLS